MRLSTDRILTTHVGSLPRPDDVAALLEAKEFGEDYDARAFEARMDSAVAECVADQRAIGLDVINDGEITKTGYATYIQDRLSGFSGDSPSVLFDDLSEFPDYRRRMGQAAGARRLRRPQCTGPIALADTAPLARDIARLRSAMETEGAGAADVFMNAASPGVIAVFQDNRHYASLDDYIDALAAAMSGEYRAIAEAGFVLQLDCPDLAMGRHVTFRELDENGFVRRAERLVDAMNAALADVPAEAARMHVCWGNYEGPHHKDIELARIVEVLFRAKPQGLSFEAANPRHAHEWKVFAEIGVPEDKVLIPGVIDSTTNYVEHPDLVAERICRFADIVGRERVIAGADCGFATFAGISKIDPAIARLKLEALVAGAEVASKRLWPGAS
jgi:5-methyltetrahydropteroyltriglutamate--homocysteine methyltransferase